MNQYTVTASTLTWDIYSTVNWPAKCTAQTGTCSKLTSSSGWCLHRLYAPLDLFQHKLGCVVKFFFCFVFLWGAIRRDVNKTLIHKQMKVFCCFFFLVLFTSWCGSAWPAVQETSRRWPQWPILSFSWIAPFEDTCVSDSWYEPHMPHILFAVLC